MAVWNPLREMENMLERYTHATRRDIGNSDIDADLGFAKWAPTVDIEENDDSYFIRADIPGVDKKDIEVRLDNGVLSITGEKLVEKETGKGSKHHRMERYSGSFARRFTLPNTIKAGKVDATYRYGVLSLMIPKTEESRPKPIEIKVH